MVVAVVEEVGEVPRCAAVAAAAAAAPPPLLLLLVLVPPLRDGVAGLTIVGTGCTEGFAPGFPCGCSTVTSSNLCRQSKKEEDEEETRKEKKKSEPETPTGKATVGRHDGKHNRRTKKDTHSMDGAGACFVLLCTTHPDSGGSSASAFFDI